MQLQEIRTSIARIARTRPARYLLVLLVLVACVALYWRFWRPRPLPVNLPEVPTMGGTTGVYKAPPVPKAMPSGAVVTRPRVVQTVPVSALPAPERALVPVLDPQKYAIRPGAPGEPAATADPELAAASSLPASRAGGEARTYLMPDGSFETTWKPAQEAFFGFHPRKLELEAGLGIGAVTVEATARWMPVRLGDVHLGVEATGWADDGGTLRGAALLKVRWEPWR